MKKAQLTPGVAFGLLSALFVCGYLTVNKYIYAHFHIGALQYSMFFAITGGLFAMISLLSRADSDTYKAIRSKLWPLVLLSVAGFVAVGLFIIGLHYTTAVNAALIITSTIVATLLFSFFLLGEHLGRGRLVWVAVLFAGLYIGIVGFTRLQVRAGDLIVLSSVLFFGFGNAYSRVVMRDMKNPGLVPDARLAFGVVFALIVILVTTHDYAIFVKVLPYGLLAGLFYWLCMKTFAKSVYLLNAHEAIILNNTQIFFTALAGVVILAEPYTLEKFLGSLIVIVSVYFISIRANPPSPGSKIRN